MDIVLSPHALLGCVLCDSTASPPLAGFHVGYESGVWRYTDLVKALIRALPDFALTASEKAALDHDNALRLLAEAARTVYQTDKYGKRGEFGELLLHVVLTRHFDTVPAISKLYYKDGPNETVKGFDAVHVVVTADDLELWLGEVKFYSSIGSAINAVVEELEAHAQRAYLRNEFHFVRNKIDPAWPHADRLKALLDPEVSLDQVFDRIRVPVLLTYESPTVAGASAVSEEFSRALEEELRGHHATFSGKALPEQLSIILILIPLAEKKPILDLLHQRLFELQEF
jgi:hypothetical protein